MSTITYQELGHCVKPIILNLSRFMGDLDLITRLLKLIAFLTSFKIRLVLTSTHQD